MASLVVLTLNIWNRQGPWERRLPLLRDAFTRLAPDVIGLQEVMAFGGRSQADELADGLGLHAHYGVAWPMGGGLSMGNAILSPHPLVETDVLPLPAPDGFDPPPNKLKLNNGNAGFGSLGFRCISNSA